VEVAVPCMPKMKVGDNSGKYSILNNFVISHHSLNKLDGLAEVTVPYIAKGIWEIIAVIPNFANNFVIFHPRLMKLKCMRELQSPQLPNQRWG
jgi:hypothetical protein